MKLTYLILLTLAIFACLASITEAGRKNKDKRLSKGSRKAGSRFNAVGKGKKKGRKGGKRRNRFNKKDEDDEEDNKGKKSKRGRGKGKGSKRSKLNKRRKSGKKGRKGVRKANKDFRKSEKADFKKKGKKPGKGKGKGKKPKMCKQYQVRALPQNIVVHYATYFPDGYTEVVRAVPDFGYVTLCEYWSCEGKFWVMNQHKCTFCTLGGDTYDVGQCIPLPNPYTKMQCMANPTTPTGAASWKKIGSKSFPMSLTAIMKKTGHINACFGTP